MSLDSHANRLKERAVSEQQRFAALSTAHGRLNLKAMQILRKIELLRNYKVSLQKGEFQ